MRTSIRAAVWCQIERMERLVFKNDTLLPHRSIGCIGARGFLDRAACEAPAEEISPVSQPDLVKPFYIPFASQLAFPPCSRISGLFKEARHSRIVSPIDRAGGPPRRPSSAVRCRLTVQISLSRLARQDRDFALLLDRFGPVLQARG